MKNALTIVGTVIFSVLAVSAASGVVLELGRGHIDLLGLFYLAIFGLPALAGWRKMGLNAEEKWRRRAEAKRQAQLSQGTESNEVPGEARGL